MGLSSFRNGIRFLCCLSLSCSLLACLSDTDSQKLNPLSSIQASSFLIHKEQYIIAGTAKDSLHSTLIKSPFVIVLDTSLNKKAQHVFTTTTTALNPQLSLTPSDDYLLSYYRAKSLADQTEVSEINYLNQSFQINKTLTYGERTRIKDLVNHDNQLVATLNYERSSQEISIQFFKHVKQDAVLSFSETDDTNIPTAILSLENVGYAFSGIAHGFHYPDGHDYKYPKTVSYIITTDESGQELNRSIHKGHGHVFINDLKQQGKSIVAIGTHQSPQTSMDVFLIRLDKDLNILSQLVVAEEGLQEGLVATQKDESLYVASTTEDLHNHSMTCQLQRIDRDNKVEWTIKIEENGSWTPQDLVIHQNKLLCLVVSKASRTAHPQSHVFSYSLDGQFIKKMTLY